MAILAQDGIDVTYYDAGDPIYDDKGNRLTLLESGLTAPTGLAARGEPFVINGIVGITLRTAAASTDYLASAVSGVWCLNVVASDNRGTKAIAIGDRIYITSAGVLNAEPNGTYYGTAVTALAASGTAAKCAVMIGVPNGVGVGRIDLPLMAFIDEGEGTWIQLTTFGDGDSAVPGIVRDGTENLGIRWNNKATSNDIITQFSKPADMDTAKDAVLHIAAIRSATDATDLVTFAVVAFNASVGAASAADADYGGTTSAMIDDVLIQDVSLTLAAADLEAANGAITISFSPTATIIATIDVTVVAVWIEYAKLA